MWFFGNRQDHVEKFQSGLYVKKIHAPDSEVLCVGAIYDPDTEKVLGAWGKVVNGKTTFVEVLVEDYPNLKPSQLRDAALREAIVKNREETMSGLDSLLARRLPLAARRRGSQ